MVKIWTLPGLYFGLKDISLSAFNFGKRLFHLGNSQTFVNVPAHVNIWYEGLALEHKET